MEEGLGSAEHSGAVVKRKGPSGCLIIKKKGDGIAGLGVQNSEKGMKKIKKPRLVHSDSDSSSDDSESPPRVKTGNFGNGNSLSKKADIESERKRSGLDVFDFDEYDGYDVKKMKKDDRVGQSGKKRESLVGSGSTIVMVDKKKHSHVSSKTFNKKGNDEDDMITISSLREKYKESCNEPIRLQGKNGVLKVMVNKHKNLGSRSELVTKTSKVVPPSSHSDSKRIEKRVSFVETDRVEVKSQKTVSAKRSTVKDSEDVDIDTPRKLGSGSMKADSSVKTVKKETITNLGTEKTTLMKRSGSTEKQKLREKVRGMLLDKGWTIDYRPRKNRDYIDAVYIAPNGSAYWSIVKAYDAFQKQQEEEDIDDMDDESSEFGHLSEEIRKLTRQTRKKMEREMKKRSRDEDSEEKLSYYLKQNQKSRKRKSHEGEESGDEKSAVQMNSRSAKTGRCTLLVRKSETEANSDDSDDGFVPYTGKRTVLAWLIDSGTVRMSEKVQYMNRRKTRAMLEGWVTREGIHCGCCSKILTVTKFEIHAGSKQKQPFSNIFLESGRSLLECQIEAWNKQDESISNAFHRVDVDGDDPNDDTCGLCGDGGDLICCDGCPSTFHQSCLNIEMLPQGEWSCPNCTCKFCGVGGVTNAKAKGTTDDSLFTCNLCEKKYHGSCGQEIDNKPKSKNATAFCGEMCQQLYGELWKLLGVKHELEEGYSWTLIHRIDTSSSSSDMRHHQMVECNSKLAVALSVMDECFLPIVDRRSEVNIVQSVVYNCGSNFDRLNYKGFYTIILERADEIICAASIRIRGTQLAEMPFIGTRHMYRRKGMCRRLFGAIESVLSSLKVEKLIIPAIAEHMHTWTEAFKFKPLQEFHKQEMRSFNMLVFPGVDMLQKQLLNPDEKNINSDSDTENVESEDDPQPATDNDDSNDETKSPVSSEEESIDADAEIKCPTPSDQSPLNLQNSTPEGSENSGDTSSADLVLDNMEEAKENGNPTSVSTPTSEENSENPKAETDNVQQDETDVSSSPPANGHEKSNEAPCVESVLEDMEEAKENGNPISVSTLTEENHESPKKDTKNVHQDETGVSCSPLEGSTEPNTLESRSSELSNEDVNVHMNNGTCAADEKPEPQNDCDDAGKRIENKSVSSDRHCEAEV
jgi:hypothetical protein